MRIPRSNDVNNFENPEKLPVLGHDEIAKFELIDMPKDPDHPDRLLIPYAKMVPCRQRIVDPTIDYAPGQPKRWMVMSNIIEEYMDGSYKEKHPAFHHSQGGVKILHGNIPAEADEYTFMKLSNQNEDNPHRDPSVPAWFREINEAKKAKEIRGNRANMLKAFKLVFEMNEVRKREFAASMGWDQNADLDVISNKIEQLAEDDPQEFMNRYGDETRDIKASVKQALDENIVKYDVQKRKFVWTADNETLYATPQEVSPDEMVSALSDFFISNPKASAKYDLMVKRTKAKLSLKESD